MSNLLDLGAIYETLRICGRLSAGQPEALLAECERLRRANTELVSLINGEMPASMRFVMEKEAAEIIERITQTKK